MGIETLYKEMKIIFLDIDGVLNVIPDGRDIFGPIFDKNFTTNLENIIISTGAKIVISSSWRFDGIEKIKSMWKFRNLPGEVIDITPDCTQLNFEYFDQVERGHEIQDWLNRNPQVKKYVILDDDNDMLRSQISNFVRTSNNKDSAISLYYRLPNLSYFDTISLSRLS